VHDRDVDDAIRGERTTPCEDPDGSDDVLGGTVTAIHLGVELPFASTTGSTDEQFEEFLDAVVDALDNIGREVTLAARLADRVADFATTVEAEKIEDAVNEFMPDLRTALHAAGCSTAGWPHFTPENPVIRQVQHA
jgi:hypothetical protein